MGKMIQVTVRLSKEQVEELDSVAKFANARDPLGRDVTRSDCARFVIERGLEWIRNEYGHETKVSNDDDACPCPNSQRSPA